MVNFILFIFSYKVIIQQKKITMGQLIINSSSATNQMSSDKNAKTTNKRFWQNAKNADKQTKIPQ